MTQPPPHLVPGTPVFFLSHAWTKVDVPHHGGEGAGHDTHLLVFFQDLCRHVRQLVGSRTGATPGFIDRSVGSGEIWESNILDTVLRVPVFVALLSVDYVESLWCGKEWDAFSRRRPRHVDGSDSTNASTILPVIWSPIPGRPLPAVVEKVQYWAPDFRVEPGLNGPYVENGIYGLLAAGRQEYQAVVWQLAKRIAYLFHAFDVPAGDPVTLAELRNVFEGAAR